MLNTRKVVAPLLYIKFHSISYYFHFDSVIWPTVLFQKNEDANISSFRPNTVDRKVEFRQFHETFTFFFFFLQLAARNFDAFDFKFQY